MNNSPENFNVTLTGNAIEKQVLVVQVDGNLRDLDVVGVIRYQWQRSDGQGSWVDIAGATSTSYALGDADVGYQIRVQVYYVDGGGTTETAFSNPTLPIANVDDQAVMGISKIGTVAEGQTLNLDAAATDADGAIVSTTYQWQVSADGATWTNIADATSSSYAIPSDQSLVGQFLRTLVTTTDARGGTTTATPDWGQVANVNDAPLGFGVSISGTATEDATLTATASVTSDEDGLSNPLNFTYQWQSSSDGSTWSNISGATAANFTPGDTHVGKQLRAVTTYTDSQGTTETVTSASTSAVANVNDVAAGSLRMLSQVEETTRTLFSEFRVNSTTADYQMFPSISPLTGGGWITTWTAAGQDGSSWGVYGQRHGSSGEPVGAEFQINLKIRQYIDRIHKYEA